MSRILALIVLLAIFILGAIGVSSYFIKQEETITSIKKEIKELKKEIVKAKQEKTKVSLKKQNFLDTIVPITQAVYKELYSGYINTKHLLEQNRTNPYIESLKIFYRSKSNKDLLASLKPHPISIALAQCAMESAWLTSRFSKDANNIFGVWSFNKNEPRIAASGLRGDKVIYLKKYPNYYESIKDYYKTIGKSWAFKEFREKRLITDDPFKLLPYLHKYSEQKDEYPKTLKRVIEKNKFTQYDIREEK